MRVALIHSFYSASQPSGENDVVVAQAQALERHGHTVNLIAVRTDDLSRSRLYAARAAAGVATGTGIDPSHLLRNFGPDVIHLHNLFPNFSHNWIKTIGVPTVATLHNYRPLCAAGSFFRDGKDCYKCPSNGSISAVIHACYRDSRVATIPLAISTRAAGLRNPLIENVGHAVFLSERARITFSAYSGIDLRRRSSVVPNFLEVAESEPANSQDGFWIYVGRLAAEKGILELVRAWPERLPLRVLGSGPLETDVRAAAEGKNIDVRGVVPSTEVQGHVKASKGLIFPSIWQEPAPAVAYLHALASGKPTLALSGNAVGDDVEEYLTGAAFRSMADLVSAASQNRAWQTEGIAATKRHLEAFSSAAWVRSMTDIYERTIDEYKG